MLCTEALWGRSDEKLPPKHADLPMKIYGEETAPCVYKEQIDAQYDMSSICSWWWSWLRRSCLPWQGWLKKRGGSAWRTDSSSGKITLEKGSHPPPHKFIISMSFRNSSQKSTYSIHFSHTWHPPWPPTPEHILYLETVCLSVGLIAIWNKFSWVLLYDMICHLIQNIMLSAASP